MLFRSLADPEELEFMGIRYYLSKRSICLVEWPSQASGALPNADVNIHLIYDNFARIANIDLVTNKVHL